MAFEFVLVMPGSIQGNLIPFDYLAECLQLDSQLWAVYIASEV
jgi:hypothetical protein